MDDKNRSKRRQTCRLDLRYVIFFFFRILLILTNVLLYKQVVIYEIRDGMVREGRDDENRSKRCQTHRLGR
jgi:hypothetical protein